MTVARAGEIVLLAGVAALACGSERLRLGSGRPPPAVVADGQSRPFAIATDGAYLYWASFDNGTVARAPLGGGSATVLATGLGEIYGLVLAGGRVYFASRSTGWIGSFPAEGGTVDRLVIAQPFPEGLADDGSFLYWTSGNAPGAELCRISLDGGPVQRLASPFGGDMIAIRAGMVYASSYSTGEVLEVPVAGGTPRAIATGQTGVWGLATDDTYVYWANDQPSGSVMRVAPGGKPEVLAAGQDGAHSVAVDGGEVYWTAEHAGTVSKLVPGSTAILIATGQDTPKNLLLAGDSVFWTNMGGTVMRAPR